MTASALYKLAEEAERQEVPRVMADVARLVGIGEADLTSRDRRETIARARAVAAWILVDRLGWSQRKTAHHLRRTLREIERMLKKQRATERK